MIKSKFNEPTKLFSFLTINRSDHSEKGVRFIYGKWTEFIKCTDFDSYEEYLKENPQKFRRSERNKSPNESPAHTPRKVLSKLNSLKMSSFRSLSIQEVRYDDDGKFCSFFFLFVCCEYNSMKILAGRNGRAIGW